MLNLLTEPTKDVSTATSISAVVVPVSSTVPVARPPVNDIPTKSPPAGRKSEEEMFWSLQPYCVYIKWWAKGIQEFIKVCKKRTLKWGKNKKQNEILKAILLKVEICTTLLFCWPFVFVLCCAVGFFFVVLFHIKPYSFNPPLKDPTGCTWG